VIITCGYAVTHWLAAPSLYARECETYCQLRAPGANAAAKHVFELEALADAVSRPAWRVRPSWYCHATPSISCIETILTIKISLLKWTAQTRADRKYRDESL
jgi:hypothetical protein